MIEKIVLRRLKKWKTPNSVFQEAPKFNDVKN